MSVAYSSGDPNRRSQRQSNSLDRARAREARWQNNRLAVPYPTDGPKVTFGVLWFLALIGGSLLGAYFEQPAIAAVGIAGVAAPVAGLAGLQTGNAWFPKLSATRAWTAVAAYLTGISGFFGPWGVVIGVALGLIVLLFYVVLYRGHRRTACGDFIVGSGSANAFEGPLAGLVALGAVAFLLFLIQPAPFDSFTILLFSALAAVCCPLGQILASGLLPRGNAWAPALRRLDSYLLAAPIWLILVLQL